jgi:hypothetical protein
VTCELAVAIQFQVKADDPMCMAMMYRRDVCGIDDYANFAAHTEREMAILYWIPSISGCLYLVGALASKARPSVAKSTIR